VPSGEPGRETVPAGSALSARGAPE
jgi:hypothetical protein